MRAEKYRKKAVVIEALQWTGSNFNDIRQFIGDKMPAHQMGDDKLGITTLEGVMAAIPTDWIIKGVKNEFYPCKNDIFEATYEKVYAEESGS